MIHPSIEERLRQAAEAAHLRELQDDVEVTAIRLRGMKERATRRDALALESGAILLEDLVYELARRMDGRPLTATEVRERVEHAGRAAVQAFGDRLDAAVAEFARRVLEGK